MCFLCFGVGLVWWVGGVVGGGGGCGGGGGGGKWYHTGFYIKEIGEL